VYGPRQRPDLAIHKFARRMLQGDSIPVFGDGSTRRDYTYIDDIVQGVRAAMEYDRSAYEVINLGNNRTVGLLEMIRTLEEALGVEARLEQLPPQPGDVPQTWADVTRAEQLLGYHPGTQFHEGVARFAAWLQAVE
ncbi:MAG TPA: GDP-mannose 4,6-dehydratase, partial [Longimicrobiaceae bacterium]|nr:GDP-mannose 4,6-dehydratase [Longimicrobiaceae bacterium]